jgi:RimJ/RimL family protein N-acetyltransferase
MTGPKAARPPKPISLVGRYCRLEPLDIHHAPALFASTCAGGAKDHYAYLPETAPATEGELAEWIKTTKTRTDWLTFGVIEAKTDLCSGRQSLMRIRPEHASIEIGAIVWGTGLARTRAATEAFFLLAAHMFNDLGYLRFEWKCNAKNAASMAAANRFGFVYEGTFRADMIVKGHRRDTAWFSILANEWPEIEARLEGWLDPDNFDATGQQRQSLSQI